MKEAEAGYEASRLVTCVEADGFIVATKIICSLFVATLEEKSKFILKGHSECKDDHIVHN